MIKVPQFEYGQVMTIRRNDEIFDVIVVKRFPRTSRPYVFARVDNATKILHPRYDEFEVVVATISSGTITVVEHDLVPSGKLIPELWIGDTFTLVQPMIKEFVVCGVNWFDGIISLEYKSFSGVTQKDYLRLGVDFDGDDIANHVRPVKNWS